MKKLVSLLVVAMMVFAFAGVAFAAVSDMAGHWAAADVQALIDKGIVSGDDQGKFNPENKVTRAEFAKMIVKAKGLAVENPATPTFSDVPKDAWFYGYVEAAAKAGLVKGFDGKFDPYANITRQDVAVIVARALNLDTTGTPDFSDAASISAYAKGAVAAAAKAGIVKGFDGKFNPLANATRAEAAVMVLRQVNYKAPVATNVITKNLNPNDPDVEIDGKLYTFETGALFKIAGKFVTDKTLFVKGTPVIITFGDKDKIAILEGTPKVVEGKLEAKGTSADGRTVLVNGKTLVYVKTEDEKGTIKYADVTINSSYKFLLNKDGKVYAALTSSATKKTGKITTIGQKVVDDKDQYYIAIDGTVYNVKKGIVPGDNSFPKVKINGLDGVWNDLDTDMAATVELNANGEISEIKAFDVEVNGKTIKWGSNYAVFTNIDGDKKYLKNVISVGDSVFIGENTTESDAKANRTEIPSDKTVLMVSSNATIKIDGVIKKYEDIKADKYVRLTVNGEGIVTAIEVTKGEVMGQVESFTENDDEKVTSITIAGVKYNINDKYYLDNSSDILKNSMVVIAELNTAGEIVNFDSEDIIVLKKNADDEVKAFAVIATPFEKGRPMSGNEDTYTDVNTLRLMDNSTGAVFEINVQNAKLIKAGKEIKLNEIKKGDSIGYDTDGKVVVVNPIK